MQVKAEVLLAVSEILDAEELEGLFRGFGVIGIRVLEWKAGEGRLRWEEEAIAEGELGVDVM